MDSKFLQVKMFASDRSISIKQSTMKVIKNGFIILERLNQGLKGFRLVILDAILMNVKRIIIIIIIIIM